MLLNYCYGHTNSSLLFFPYSPSVNAINHGSVEDSNAEIRWSTYPYHKAEWLDSTLEETKDRLKTGLMFDIIATRDLRRGEEILLYYGKDWEESWHQHVREWPKLIQRDDDESTFNMTERLRLPTIADLNSIGQNPVVRTVEEQLEEPYPSFMMTRCQFEPTEDDCVSPIIEGDFDCRARWGLTTYGQDKHSYPCTILNRESIQGMDWYTARIEVQPEGKDETTIYLVEYMPRYAVVFVDKPYAKDQFAHGVFRHEIGLPSGMMPPHWLDLDGGADGNEYTAG